jgi:hypothetical protein
VSRTQVRANSQQCVLQRAVCSCTLPGCLRAWSDAGCRACVSTQWAWVADMRYPNVSNECCDVLGTLVSPNERVHGEPRRRTAICPLDHQTHPSDQCSEAVQVLATIPTSRINRCAAMRGLGCHAASHPRSSELRTRVSRVSLDGGWVAVRLLVPLKVAGDQRVARRTGRASRPCRRFAGWAREGRIVLDPGGSYRGGGGLRLLGQVVKRVGVHAARRGGRRRRRLHRRRRHGLRLGRGWLAVARAGRHGGV